MHCVCAVVIFHVFLDSSLGIVECGATLMSSLMFVDSSEVFYQLIHVVMQGLCWHPQLRVQGLPFEARASACNCRLWF